MSWIRTLRICILGAALAAVSVAQARLTTNVGAILDSGNNMMTASSLPNDAYLRVSWRNSNNSSQWVKDFAAPAGYTFGTQQLLAEVGTTGVFYVATTITNSTTLNQEYEVLKLSSTGTLSDSYQYSTPSGTYAYLTGLFLGYNNTPYMVVNNLDSTTSDSTAYIAQFATDLSTVTSDALPTNMFVDDAVMDSSYNVYMSGTQPTGIISTPWNLSVVKYETDQSSTAGLWYQWQYIDNSAAATLNPVQGEGCLTLDSSGNLTYLITMYDTSTTDYSIYALQTTASSAGTNWTAAVNLGTTDQIVTSTAVDSSGNIYYVVANIALSTNNGYKIGKFTQTGTLSWSSSASVTGYMANMVAIDAGGDPLIAVTSVGGSLGSLLVQRWHAAGTFDISYSHTPSAGNAATTVVLPTTTSGSFYGFGMGYSSSVLYPECYHNTGTTLVWGDIQTADT